MNWADDYYFGVDDVVCYIIIIINIIIINTIIINIITIIINTIRRIMMMLINLAGLE